MQFKLNAAARLKVMAGKQVPKVSRKFLVDLGLHPEAKPTSNEASIGRHESYSTFLVKEDLATAKNIVATKLGRKGVKGPYPSSAQWLINIDDELKIMILRHEKERDGSRVTYVTLKDGPNSVPWVYENMVAIKG